MWLACSKLEKIVCKDFPKMEENVKEKWKVRLRQMLMICSSNTIFANLPCIPCSLQDRTSNFQDNQIMQDKYKNGVWGADGSRLWYFTLTHLQKHLHKGCRCFMPLRTNVELVSVLSFTVFLDNCFVHVFTEGVGREPIRNQYPSGH